MADLSDEIYEALKQPWLDAKPSESAQRIRSEVGHLSPLTEDMLDAIPDFVWRLLDIAVQRGFDLKDREREELRAALRGLLNAIKDDHGERHYRGLFIATEKARAVLAKAAKE